MSHILDVVLPSEIDVDYGKGSYLIDKQGKKYLDSFSGIAVNALGHNHPAMLKTLNKHASRYLHLSNVFRTDTQEKLAKQLVDHTGAKKVFFTNSGTEANEAAIKLVRKRGNAIHPDKIRIVSVRDAFHGRSSGGMALSGHASKHKAFKPILPNIDHVHKNDGKHLTSLMDDSVCAIFLELIHGSSGIHVLENNFLQLVMTLAKKYDALIVVDEVQTGFMRTGTMFYYEQTPIKPDIITLAKAIGGGLPLGAMLVNEAYINVLKPGEHGTTFGGNPLACGLGSTFIETITTQPFKQTLDESIAYLDKILTQLQNDYPAIIKEIRGIGFMRGIEVRVDAEKLQKKALENGLILNLISGNVIRLLPALTFSKNDIETFNQIMRLTIAHLS